MPLPVLRHHRWACWPLLWACCAPAWAKRESFPALNGGTYFLTCGVFAALTFIACLASGFELRLWGAARMVGMLAGVIIGITSDFFTGDDKSLLPRWLRPARAARRSPSSPVFLWVLSALPALVGVDSRRSFPAAVGAPWAQGMRCWASPCGHRNVLSIVGHDHLQRRLRPHRGQRPGRGGNGGPWR